MVIPTPKFKTREFKDALLAVKTIFDSHSLGVILLDALERQPAEQIFSKLGKNTHGARLANLKKTDLVGHITAAFFTIDEIAYAVMRELDRACHKERHIVASIPEDQAPDRVGSYRAIALKRERAKLVWALARDERAHVRTLANRVIKEFFAEAADVETARAVLEGEADQTALKGVELASRLKEQAERLTEAADKVNLLESKVSAFEEERAKLLASMGAKERVLRHEVEAREDLEAQLLELKRTLEAVESGKEKAEAARQSELEARALADDLAQKVRRLSKLASVSETLAATQTALEAAHRKIDELGRQFEREARVFAGERESFDRELARQRGEIETLREELKHARRHITELERRPERMTEVAPREFGVERVTILLDQANLAATAFSAFGRKVNFSALLDHLLKGRTRVHAIAFVVDNGGTLFDAFLDTLRKSGWELRIKRPKVFADGKTKADWDMGIAMEAIALRETSDTMVLVSGDGDFAPLVRQLRRFGLRTEVAAYAEGLSLELTSAADAVLRLDASTLE